MSLEAPGSEPIVLDLGTGLRRWGLAIPTEDVFHGSALVTHLHWDHVQGLPFFVPVLAAGAQLDVYGPPQDGESLDEAFRRFICPPYFPVTVDELHGRIRFHDVTSEDLELDGAKVRVRPVPHIGTTNGYRVEMEGCTVAYLPDHQMPQDGSHRVSDDVLELCDGADVVIHDAQYTKAEFSQKAHWGHCTVDYALFVAREAGAKRVVLFHHDPAHDDDKMDEILRYAEDLGERTPLSEILAAYENLSISLGD